MIEDEESKRLETDNLMDKIKQIERFMLDWQAFEIHGASEFSD